MDDDTTKTDAIAASSGEDPVPLRHFCASAYVYDAVANRFLFVRHRKLHLWIPPGGHVEENESPDETARREVAEETGVAVRIVDWPCQIFPGEKAMRQPIAMRVYDCGPAHEHMSFVYGAVPVGGHLRASERDLEDVGWFSAAQIGKESFAAPSDVRAWCRHLSSGDRARFFLRECQKTPLKG
jgi:ADP-ribose pyrophosphatase YjhB (NUDIX family)